MRAPWCEVECDERVREVGLTRQAVGDWPAEADVLCCPQDKLGPLCMVVQSMLRQEQQQGHDLMHTTNP